MGIQEKIEGMGLRLGEHLSGFDLATELLETCEGPSGFDVVSRKRVREQAIPVAQVKDAKGKTGIAYFWNTGELELSWV